MQPIEDIRRSGIRLSGAWVRLTMAAGLLGAVLMTSGWILAGFLQPASYSWTAQEISDLGALTAHHARVWNLADSLSGVLIAAFAVGLYRIVGSRRSGRIAALSVGVVGIGSVLDGFLREDCPLSTSAACRRRAETVGLSWHHQAHDIESIVVFAAMLIGPFMLAKVFRRANELRGLRAFSLEVGIALSAATGAYLALSGRAGGGVAERAMALIYSGWVAVLAIAMLRRPQAAPRESAPEVRVAVDDA
ncbi:MAG TPA: DUF998 domain-containing protein [Burkholderiales bacterium]|nr:DUF998 domain-containing protein [Burkholderiales bacterium]